MLCYPFRLYDSVYLPDILKLTGIYKIVNKVDNKCYIGSAATYFKRRIRQHYFSLIKNTHENKYLQNAFNKYGINNFYFEIIEICPEKDVLKKEQYHLDTINPEYNLSPTAGNIKGVKRPLHAIQATAAKNRGRKSPDSVRKAVTESNKRRGKGKQDLKRYKGVFTRKIKYKSNPVVNTKGEIFADVYVAALNKNINPQSIKDNIVGRTV